MARACVLDELGASRGEEQRESRAPSRWARRHLTPLLQRMSRLLSSVPSRPNRLSWCSRATPSPRKRGRNTPSACHEPAREDASTLEALLLSARSEMTVPWSSIKAPLNMALRELERTLEQDDDDEA